MTEISPGILHLKVWSDFWGPLQYVTVLALGLAASSYAYGSEMDGEWVSISRISAGEQQLTTPTRAVIKDGKFSTVRDGKLSELGNIRETRSEIPNGYDVEMTGEVELSGKSFHGIYSISGDTMLTCVNPKPSGKRPKFFSSTKENGHVMIVWMRKSAFAKVKKPLKKATDVSEGNKK